MSGSSPRLSPFLARIPWWLSIGLAVASYLGLKHLLPNLAISYPAFQPLAGFMPKVAPLAAIGFLLLAAVQLYADEEEPPPNPEEKPEDQ